MTIKIIRPAFTVLLMFCATLASAQSQPQIINIPISSPGEPITLDISILSASIEVIGEDRGDAQFEVTVVFDLLDLRR